MYRASFIVIIALAALLSACQNQQLANSNGLSQNKNSTASQHDMGNMAHDMSNMANAAESAPGAAAQPYDLQFLDSMTHHHDGAVQMAKMVLGKTERTELKTFAQKVIEDQSREIADMKRLREQWYSDKPSAMNMGMPGMQDSGLKMMNSEHMKMMDEMESAHFDDHFLKMMIPHHQGAIDMSKDALTKAEHPEIKDLARQIIAAQEAEIKQMRRWQAEFNK